MIRYEPRAMFDPKGSVDPWIIVHGVNCQGVMGAGFALTIKNKFPKAYEDYQKISKRSEEEPKELLGEICVSNASPERKVSDLQTYVIHAFIQERYGRNLEVRYVSYDAVDKAMKHIKMWYDGHELTTTIGMPKIGSGLGGGDWNVIEAIINHRLKNISVLVYDPQ